MELARARVLRAAGRYPQASEAIEALRARIDALDHPPLRAEYLYMRGATAVDRGDAKAGEDELYAAARAAAAAGHARIEAQVWMALVRVVGTQQDRPLELRPLVKAAEVAVVRAGDDVGDRGALALVVGIQQLSRGEYTPAEERLHEAVTLLTEARGPEHPDTLEARSMLALTMHGRKRWNEAESELSAVADAIERTQGNTHPTLAPVLANLSRIHAARGQLELASTTGERALAALVAGYGPRHQTVATAHANLATTLRKLERYDEAAIHIDAALAIERELFGEESPRIATTLHARAQLSLARDAPEAALPDYREALRIWEATLPAGDPTSAYALTGIGKAELARGDAEAAIVALERALALREAGKDVARDDLADTRFVLAKALRAAGRDAVRAVALAKQARTAFEALDAGEDLRLADAFLAATK
jgi:tetratricopeptide (TPR) repeat protein